MRNRFYYVLIGILFGFSFINNVFADTVVSLDTNATTVPEGTIVSIFVSVKSDVSLSSCLFQISSDGDVAFQSNSGANGWYTSSESSVGTFLKNPVTSADLSNGFKVLELRYRINGNGSVSVETLNCINAANDESITSVASTSLQFTATEAVKDTTLSSLTVGGGILTSTFSPERYIYDVRLSNSNFSLFYVANDVDLSDKVVVMHNDKTISNLNNIAFVGDDQGAMVLKVIIDGKTTYTLNLKYQQTGLDNTLKSVTFNGKELKLEKGKYNYEYTVGKDITSFTVTAVLNDSENFKFNSIGNVDGTGNFNIVDEVDVMIVIEPKSAGTGIGHLTYTIRVKKEGIVTKPGSSKPNVGDNPGTGGISMYIMSFVLMVSLIGSMILYRKNIEGYK